jgi:hypothetical protein
MATVLFVGLLIPTPLTQSYQTCHLTTTVTKAGVLPYNSLIKKTDPVFHTDIPPDWTGDTSGIDERAEAPIVLWFPLQRTVALDYKYHI